MTARALLISGAGRYEDPWHPFARTSAAIAEIVTKAGVAVEIAEDVDDALGGLAESAPDLLMLNIGDPAGTTMHPDLGDARIEVDTDAHPIVAGVADFEVHDERYSWMRTSPEVRGLAWHEHDGGRHPLLWTHDYDGARVVYDALGHDVRSYQSATRGTLVARTAV